MSILESEREEGRPCTYKPPNYRSQHVLTPKFTVPRNVFARVAAIANDNGLFTRNSEQTIESLRCEFCQACVPIRINISKASLSRSHRRTMKKGNIRFASSGFKRAPNREAQFHSTIEQYSHLMSSYLHQRHDILSTRDNLRPEIIKSTNVLEISQRETGKLSGLALMSIADGRVMLDKIYYDMKQSTDISLGQFVLLKVIEAAKEKGLEFIYPAPWVKGSKTMDYKKGFPGLETYQDGAWVDFDPDLHASGLSPAELIASETRTKEQVAVIEQNLRY